MPDQRECGEFVDDLAIHFLNDIKVLETVMMSINRWSSLGSVDDHDQDVDDHDQDVDDHDQGGDDHDQQTRK